MRIVHLGPGNFFRAHVAWFTAHAGDAADWTIAAFAGRTGASVAELREHRYPLVVRAADGDRRETIDIVVAVSADRADWLAWFAAPDLAVVTATVTEAGWNASGPDSAPARIAAGLAERRAAGLPGVAIVPCDNLPSNGEYAARVVTEAADPGTGEWIAANVSFVSTVVDRITPRPSAADRVDDPALVITEPFAEWVLAGTFPVGRPRWEDAGARFVEDVEPFERRKLWLLNGAHSLLAYAGSARGHETVADAIADPVLRGWVEGWWDAAAPHVGLPAADIGAYRVALLERWANPRIHHRLAQIAVDGSQKIPVRVPPVLDAELAEGRVPAGAVRILAAWIAHLRGVGNAQAPVDDVDAARFVAAAQDGPEHVLALIGVTDERVIDAVDTALRSAPPIEVPTVDTTQHVDLLRCDMSDPWGLRQPPAGPEQPGALPQRLTRLANVQATGIALTVEDPYAQGFPSAEELPEVQTLMQQGWRPLHGAPLYCLLPAAWPSEHRTWVADRLPKVGMGSTTDTYYGEISALPDDEGWPDSHPAERARAVGLADPPADRIWLLRSPWPRIPVLVIYEIIWSVVERTPTRDEIAAVYLVAKDILTWDEEQALDACPAATRELLEAWAHAGRVGETATELIEHQLQPAVLEDALARTRVDEPALLAWLSSLNSELDHDTISFIRAWRERGLPGNPPPGAHRYAARDLQELQAWLEAGFDLYAATRLELAGLDTAIRWREAGFTAADTYELLRSDPALTPEEAHAFPDAGRVRDRRREWIYYGFTAPLATAWAAAGLTPYQARIWRALGKDPADVQPGQRFPAELLVGRQYISFSRVGDGEKTNSEWDAIPDPPATRGRRANG